MLANIYKFIGEISFIYFQKYWAIVFRIQLAHMVYCNVLKEKALWMRFYIFTYKCINKYNFSILVRLLPETIARDLGMSVRSDFTKNTLKQLLLN